MLILLALRRRPRLSRGLDFIISISLILLCYIDNFVAALATARILIALRSVALIFFMTALFFLLRWWRFWRCFYRPVACITTMGSLILTVETLMVLMVQGFDLLHNDADEVSRPFTPVKFHRPSVSISSYRHAIHSVLPIESLYCRARGVIMPRIDEI